MVGFEQVSDRNAAEQLRAPTLRVVPADEMPSGAEEYFDRQLIGLRRWTPPAMTSAKSSGWNITDLLVVDVAGAQRLVPFVHALVPVVDLSAGHLQLADVGGLLFDPGEDA